MNLSSTQRKATLIAADLFGRYTVLLWFIIFKACGLGHSRYYRRSELMIYKTSYQAS